MMLQSHALHAVWQATLTKLGVAQGNASRRDNNDLRFGVRVLQQIWSTCLMRHRSSASSKPAPSAIAGILTESSVREVGRQSAPSLEIAVRLAKLCA